MKTGLLYASRFLDHLPGSEHPECRERLIATLAYLKKRAWFDQLLPVEPREIERSWLETVHDPAYIDHVDKVCRSGFAHLDSLDVGICPDSAAVARMAAGGVLELADLMMAGRIRNGFGLIRPPGHHAERSRAMGFCLFNHIAILARYLQKKYGLQRILILDWDVHHGNGTQQAFEEDPGVFYVSLHQYPFYPGTGAVTETGTGAGKGYTLNCPMPAGATNEDYRFVFTDTILPRVRTYRPEAVLISAGFDAHEDDPLGQICLSTDFFGWMTQRMAELARETAQDRLISLLEGGYHLDVLPRCVAQHLAVLTGSKKLAYPL